MTGASSSMFELVDPSWRGGWCSHGQPSERRRLVRPLGWGARNLPADAARGGGTRALRHAQARRPDTDIDVDALADHLYTTFEGGFILCRTYSDRTAMRAQIRIYRQLVQALLHAD